MSRDMSIYDKYYRKGGTYELPIETFNELIDELDSLDIENEILKANAEHNDKVVDKARWNEMLYKSRCEKLREYINTHQLFKYIYDEEELFEIITDKEAKKDLENILNVSDENKQ